MNPRLTNRLTECRRVRMTALLLAVGTLAVYCQVCRFDFTNYDEPEYIYQNPIVCHGLTWPGVVWAFSTTYFDFWHPLTWCSHMLDCGLFGLQPGWHHFVNLVFHVSNTLLLFSILRRMTGALVRSTVVAALFALHPLHVESVAWLAERKDVFSTFFMLASLGQYLLWVKSIERKLPSTRVSYWFMLALFGCGLMAKPMIVTFPLVLLLLDFWPLGRVELSSPKTLWMDLIWEKLPLFGLSIASSVITYLSMARGERLFSGQAFAWSFRLANAAVSYARYLGKLVWPFDLAVIYPMPPHWGARPVTASVVLLLIISLVSIAFARRAPYLIVGWLLFLGTLIPVIGLVAMSGSAISDRYMYIPSVGIFVAAVWGLSSLAPRFRAFPGALAGAAAFVILGLGVATWVQLGVWRNSLTLWSHCVAVTRNNATAEYNLGHTFKDLGRPTAAIVHYREALRVKPDYFDASLNLGSALAADHRMQEATNWFGRALQLRPDSAMAHRNMGAALLEFGDFSSAIAECGKANRLDPTDFVALTALGRGFSAQGNSDEALRCYSEALALNPAYVEVHYYLGLEWLKRGSAAEAVSSLSEVTRLAPNRSEAHFNLALAYAQEGNASQAIAEYKQAIRLQPDSPPALNNLAWILATQADSQLRDGAQAVSLAQRACELTNGKEAVFVGTLAAALAEIGRYDEAAETARQASRLAAQNAQTNLAARNEDLAAQFSRRQPCRESNIAHRDR